MAVKFAPNKETRVTFKFDQAKEVDNKFNPGTKQYLYGVTVNGTDDYLYASEALNKEIMKFAPLKGKAIFIEKVVDETNRTRWNVSHDGVPFELEKSRLDAPKETPPTSNLEQKVDEIYRMVSQLHAKALLHDDTIKLEDSPF